MTTAGLLPRHDRLARAALRLAKQRLANAFGRTACPRTTRTPLEGSRLAGHVRTHPGGSAPPESAFRWWTKIFRDVTCVDVPLALDDEPQRRELARPDAHDVTLAVRVRRRGAWTSWSWTRSVLEAGKAGAEAEVKLLPHVDGARLVRVRFA